MRKPLFSREGANIVVHRNGQDVERADGPYGEGGWIRQAATDLFQSPAGFAVLGSWIVGDEPCGMGIREDRTVITRNSSRFVPHVIAEELS